MAPAATWPESGVWAAPDPWHPCPAERGCVLKPAPTSQQVGSQVSSDLSRFLTDSLELGVGWTILELTK